MILALLQRPGSQHHSSAPPFRGAQLNPPKETLMTWTTPTATDHRFGFEISLYISNR